MKSIKRGLAVLLAVLFVIPAQPVNAAGILPAALSEKEILREETESAEIKGKEEVQETEPENGGLSGKAKKASPGSADASAGKEKKATPDSAKKPVEKAEDEVIFNTGNYACHIVSKEDFFDNGLGDGYFEDDGSYVISIPEENPFFPYEVQFTHDGKVSSRWFMDPDDVIEVGGHQFSVSAYFDNTALTQMTLNIAGDPVVVYPEKKKFTDGGAMALSLLPLEEKYLSADLTGYTPAELTMVSFDQIFTGTEALESGEKVVWTKKYDNNDDYTINTSGDIVDLSYYTCYGGGGSWEMIVGNADQLDMSNIRYSVSFDVTRTEKWLVPQVYTEDEEGNRRSINVTEYRYRDYDYDERYIGINVPYDELKSEEKAYIGLGLNGEHFSSPKYDHLKIFEGKFTSADEAASGVDITDKIFETDMTAKGSGYLMVEKDEPWITVLTYDSEGRVTGCLPFYLRLNRMGNWIDQSLIVRTENGGSQIYGSENEKWTDGRTDVTYTLPVEYPVDGEYYLFFEYYKYGIEDSSAVTAAYVGTYASVDEANKAGAEDIKATLFSDNRDTGGYGADYSQGIHFTIIVGEDGSENQEIYHYFFQTKQGKMDEIRPSSGTYVNFNGLLDKDGNRIPSYVVNYREDSYGEYNYLTILVEEEVDLTAIAPEFLVQKGLNLYTTGGSTQEISGVSLHDFSDGPVQYTASAEDKDNSKSYWLQIVKPSTGEGRLYINSLADQDADTAEENGTVYSTREIFLDGYHNYVHDILLANMGTQEIPALSVELVSEEVELDKYWTLSGDSALGGFTTTERTKSYGELPNLAKIRLRAKQGAEGGNDIAGTLTIKSGDTALVVLNLTGVVGDPSITTKEIPQAVKYVPYGTMIQNNNKYSWNKPVYSLLDGILPKGMQIKPNGELYGVPVEAGEFTFTVKMKNSYNNFSDSTKTYTFTVVENTDTNVEGATDEGYNLTRRITNMSLNSTESQTLVSQGVYGEFTDIYLDGVKLKSGEDYTSESGSTRITIRGQTLKASNTVGTHTLGIEFRTKDTNTLKRAAQNYKIETNSSSGGSHGGSSSSSSSGGGGSTVKKTTGDSKRGVVDVVKGVVTGEGSGYSRWQQDENGWKLIYADGTSVCGNKVAQADGSFVVQVAWEKVNGAWYAFGSDGYVMSGWVFDYRLNSWYYVTIDSGMKTGWYYDEQDRCTYYLDSENGSIITGWKLIDGSWYYFAETSASPTWRFDEAQETWVYDLRSNHKPYGAMYHGENTPDGYYVGEKGNWKD